MVSYIACLEGPHAVDPDIMTSVMKS